MAQSSPASARGYRRVRRALVTSPFLSRVTSYLPSTSARILEALGQPPDVAWDEVGYGRTRAVEGLEPAAPLFPRVDEPATAA